MTFQLTHKNAEEVEYFYHFWNTVAQFIAAKTIMGLSLAAAQEPGSRVEKWQWDQEGLKFEGVWMVAR